MVGGDLERELIRYRSCEGVNEENGKTPGEEGRKANSDGGRINNTTNV